MKHAILLLWHKDLQQLKELIRFFDEDFAFYIHIDKKSVISAGDIEDLKRNRENLHFYCKYKINWGGFNIVRAELFLLQEIVKEEENFDYIHFFSGQDYPIKKLNHIKSFFEENKGYEYIEYMKLPSEKWDYGTYGRFNYYRFFDFWDVRTPQGAKKVSNLVKFQRRIGYKRRVPDQFDYLYGGSNWMSITQECAKYIVDNQKQNKPFYNRLKYTFASDEVYFHTVILNSPFAEKVKNDNVRCILWENNGSSPRTLTEKDWWSIVTSDCLFARKWDARLSAKLMEYLKKYILNTGPVAIAPQGYWQSETLAGHKYDKGLAEGLLKLLPFMGVETIADFGCGPGWYVALLRNNGYDTQGYDGNPHVEEMSALLFPDGFYCQNADLTEDLETDSPFDLIISLEVGEHIPPQWEDTFLANLVRNSGRYIILSWAVKGQPGDGHVNCRPNSYVIAKMKELGFSLNTPAGNYLRECATLWWFKDTIMFFERI